MQPSSTHLALHLKCEVALVSYSGESLVLVVSLYKLYIPSKEETDSVCYCTETNISLSDKP